MKWNKGNLIMCMCGMGSCLQNMIKISPQQLIGCTRSCSFRLQKSNCNNYKEFTSWTKRSKGFLKHHVDSSGNQHMAPVLTKSQQTRAFHTSGQRQIAPAVWALLRPIAKQVTVRGGRWVLSAIVMFRIIANSPQAVSSWSGILVVRKGGVWTRRSWAALLHHNIRLF